MLSRISRFGGAFKQANRAMTMPTRNMATRTSDQDVALAKLLLDANKFITSRKNAGDGLQLYGLVGRYSHALFNTARKVNNIDGIQAELNEVASLANESETFKLFLDDPTLSKESKLRGITAVLDKVGVSENVKNFYSTLAEHGRLDRAEKIVEGFDALVKDHKGDVEAVITVAEDSVLEGGRLEAVKDALKNWVQPHQNLIVTVKTDLNILGGMVISLGEKSIDLSLSTQINNMEKLIQESIASYGASTPFTSASDPSGWKGRSGKMIQEQVSSEIRDIDFPKLDDSVMESDFERWYKEDVAAGRVPSFLKDDVKELEKAGM